MIGFNSENKNSIPYKKTFTNSVKTFFKRKQKKKAISTECDFDKPKGNGINPEGWLKTIMP